MERVKRAFVRRDRIGPILAMTNGAAKAVGYRSFAVLANLFVAASSILVGV
jgi:hypothetical protein